MCCLLFSFLLSQAQSYEVLTYDFAGTTPTCSKVVNNYKGDLGVVIDPSDIDYVKNKKINK